MMDITRVTVYRHDMGTRQVSPGSSLERVPNAVLGGQEPGAFCECGDHIDRHGPGGKRPCWARDCPGCEGFVPAGDSPVTIETPTGSQGYGEGER